MAVVYNYGASPTYVKIASYSIGSSMSSYTFSNLPQGYTDLIVNLEITGSSTGEDAYFQFNGDTATNYNSAWIRGISNAVTTTASTGATGTRLGDGGSQTTGNTALITANIQNYSSSLLYKNVIFRTDNASRGLDMGVSVWRSNNPITSLKVYLSSGNLTSGIINIYGIKAALTPKASGGDIIVQDGKYWYHAFRTTGLFIPRQALTADILRISGGGGGGYNLAGGGGAGGVVLSTSQSLTAVNYTATIGAGGSGSVASGVIGTIGTSTTFTGGSLSLSTVFPGGGGKGDYGAAYASASTVASAGGMTGAAGGSGGTTSTGQGNAGGSNGAAYNAGGGGGAGAVGANGNGSTSGIGGAGGAGINTYSSWAYATQTGVSGYYAGGGGGSGMNTNAGTVAVGGAGGAGGGGTGGSDNGSSGVNFVLATAGSPNTGSGGGGGAWDQYNVIHAHGASGGSGLVIVRYPV